MLLRGAEPAACMSRFGGFGPDSFVAGLLARARVAVGKSGWATFESRMGLSARLTQHTGNPRNAGFLACEQGFQLDRGGVTVRAANVRNGQAVIPR